MEHLDTQTKNLSIMVVDDHPMMLRGTIALIKEHYPEATVISTESAVETLNKISLFLPDVVILDISLPEKPGMSAQTDTGISLIKQLIQQYPTLNLMVQSNNINPLIRLKPYINNHQGGFTIADKTFSPRETLKMLNWCIQGLTHTKILKTKLELKPEWVEVLNLAFKEGLTDKKIAERMYRNTRTIRNYWSKIQDVLRIYPENNQNMRSLILMGAKEQGIID